MSLTKKRLLSVIALILAFSTFFLCAETAVISDHNCSGEVCTVCALIHKIRELLVELGFISLAFCGVTVIRLALSSLARFLAQRPLSAFFTPVQLKIKLSD